MNSENDGEVKIIVHLTVLDDEVNLLSQSNQHEDVSSDIEITISRGARIAELKSILESQDLLPGADGIASDDQPIPVVEIRLTPASDLLNDDDCIPKEVTNVNVVVRHSPIRGEHFILKSFQINYFFFPFFRCIFANTPNRYFNISNNPNSSIRSVFILI